jgi:glycosyltransferase involved in cell wall biosynthesis
VTGILVPPRNAVALADAIETLVESEALRTAFGSAGFERFKVQFSRSAVGKRWTDTCLGNES